MKKHKILIAILFISTLFISCSKDEDNTRKTTIIGQWLEISVTGETIINGTSEGVENEEVIDENNYAKITFNDGGTFLIFYSNDDNGEIETDTLPGTYTIENNTIKFIYQGQQQNPEIDTFSLTENKLILTLTEEYMNDGDAYVYEEIRTFTRI